MSGGGRKLSPSYCLANGRYISLPNARNSFDCGEMDTPRYLVACESAAVYNRGWNRGDYRPTTYNLENAISRARAPPTLLRSKLTTRESHGELFFRARAQAFQRVRASTTSAYIVVFYMPPRFHFSRSHRRVSRLNRIPANCVQQVWQTANSRRYPIISSLSKRTKEGRERAIVVAAALPTISIPLTSSPCRQRKLDAPVGVTCLPVINLMVGLRAEPSRVEPCRVVLNESRARRGVPVNRPATTLVPSNG